MFRQEPVGNGNRARLRRMPSRKKARWLGLRIKVLAKSHKKTFFATMDDLHKRECLSLVSQAKAKLHPDEFRAIVALSRLEIQEKLEETQHRTHQWLTDIVAWLTQPYAPPKKWGLIYALDLGLHDERNIAETAKKIGCTRQAISVQMQDFAKMFKLQPSRWMRDDEAVRNSREARLSYCEEETPK